MKLKWIIVVGLFIFLAGFSLSFHVPENSKSIVLTQHQDLSSKKPIAVTFLKKAQNYYGAILDDCIQSMIHVCTQMQWPWQELHPNSHSGQSEDIVESIIDHINSPLAFQPLVFPLDKYRITNDHLDQLEELYSILHKNSNLKITLQGNSDHQRINYARCITIKQFLVVSGIQSSRIRIQSTKSKNQIASEQSISILPQLDRS